MKHIMHLKKKPFQSVKNGVKKYEFRLYDDKRKELSVGDDIEFISNGNLNDILVCKVKELYVADNFSQVYDFFSDDEYFESYSKDNFLQNMSIIYSQKEQEESGVLVIEIVCN